MSRSALVYKPRPDHVFVVGFSKSGTTWMRYIAHAILNDGQPADTLIDFGLGHPFLDFMGPGGIKIHLPFQKQPYSTRAKYTSTSRRFPTTTASPVYDYGEIEFDDFLAAFLDGEVIRGDFLGHLFSWYERRESRTRSLSSEDRRNYQFERMKEEHSTTAWRAETLGDSGLAAVAEPFMLLRAPPLVPLPLFFLRRNVAAIYERRQQPVVWLPRLERLPRSISDGAKQTTGKPNTLDSYRHL
ncbi:hypothetical protein HPB47_015884 [Ixodes persulcatus]|uniref:Uncharacterized protein n=1 Tax=Ixodes persulcatus TaxID=34615 RepID=A0AC60QSA4_IXOPE|nr:hypothetical protein HPB47_015884 [Ixodes persulcatus]